jgi:hypothetical protein
MKIQVQRAEHADVEVLRGFYRQESNCQIVHDSFLSRGLADPYLDLVPVDDRVGRYGALANNWWRTTGGARR